MFTIPTLIELQWYVAVGVLVGMGWKALPVLWRTRLGWQPIATHFAGVHRMITTSDALKAQVPAMQTELTVLRTEMTGLRSEVAAVRARVDKELGENGGGSMKDHVTKISDRVDTIEGRQSVIFDRQNLAGFQAEPDGRLKSVNRAFERRTGFPARDLLGTHWINLIHEDDVDDFMRVWAHMLKDGRPMRKSTRILTADRVILEIDVDATPIMKNGVVKEYQVTFDGREVPTA